MSATRRGTGDARAIVQAALGRDPGPLTFIDSLSHQVFVGADVVVKLTDRHSRLEREIALVPWLPAGLTAPLLASGHHDGVRYACYTRVPGASPGMHLSDVDAATARQLASQAVERLSLLHAWTPNDDALPTLREPLDHGGFVTQAALLDNIAAIATFDAPRHLIDGLTAIADRTPAQATVDVPVHADCHWGNWLADGPQLTALLDFEWARLGDPLDDWFFLIRFSGPHFEAVLDIVADTTAIPPDALRDGCEVREACHLASDLRIALKQQPETVAGNLRNLEELIVDRIWRRRGLDSERGGSGRAADGGG